MFQSLRYPFHARCILKLMQTIIFKKQKLKTQISLVLIFKRIPINLIHYFVLSPLGRLNARRSRM